MSPSVMLWPHHGVHVASRSLCPCALWLPPVQTEDEYAHTQQTHTHTHTEAHTQWDLLHKHIGVHRHVHPQTHTPLYVMALGILNPFGKLRATWSWVAMSHVSKTSPMQYGKLPLKLSDLKMRAESGMGLKALEPVKPGNVLTRSEAQPVSCSPCVHGPRYWYQLRPQPPARASVEDQCTVRQSCCCQMFLFTLVSYKAYCGPFILEKFPDHKLRVYI